MQFLREYFIKCNYFITNIDSRRIKKKYRIDLEMNFTEQSRFIKIEFKIYFREYEMLFKKFIIIYEKNNNHIKIEILT